MRRANLIVAEVLQALKAKIAPGVTTLDLDRVAEELTLKRNAIPAFKGYSTLPVCIDKRRNSSWNPIQSNA